MPSGVAGVTEEVLEAFADAWNRHDSDALMSFMAEDCVFEASGGPEVCGTRYAGYEAVRAGFEEVWATFPDAHWGGARHFVLGDRGVSEWTFTGTRVDGARVEVNGCDLFTFHAGKIVLKNSYRKNPRPSANRQLESARPTIARRSAMTLRSCARTSLAATSSPATGAVLRTCAACDDHHACAMIGAAHDSCFCGREATAMSVRPGTVRILLLSRWPRPVRVAIALSALAAVVLCAFLAASRAEANAGPPYYTDGQLAAEPSGMAGITISRETLIIDMRRLSVRPEYARSQTDSPEIHNPIDVSATYSITNSGPAREVALLFASGAPATAGFSVTLDGQSITAQPAISVTVPVEWLPPAKTPGLDGQDLNYLGPPNGYNGWSHLPETFARSVTSTYAFTVTIPPNDSVLAVRYRAEPQFYLTGGYTSSLNSYQFAYVLAPARAWDGFGGLDVTVHLPFCWLAASRPGLTHAGDDLTGSFDALPADALAFTVAPCDLARKTTPTCTPVGLILPLAALGLVLQRRARRRA